MATLPLTAFNSYLRKASTLLHGPAYIECKQDVDFYGSQTLTLGLIPSLAYQNESRSVYAPLDSSPQDSALLRAVFFDRNVERKRFLAGNDLYQLELPARFVLIPLEQLQHWLRLFAGIEIVIGIKKSHQDTSAITRKLQIEWVSNSKSFGLTWVSSDLDRNFLNPLWNQVWLEMDNLLATSPVVHVLDERLFRSEIVPTYKLSEYLPTKLTSYLNDE